MTAAVPDDDLAVLAGVQGVLIEILEARNADLTAQVTALEEQLERLERALSRNSGNSGMPPSAGDLPRKTPPAPKPKRGDGTRRQGKQRGAPGAHLAWSEHPDKREDLFPERVIPFLNGPSSSGKSVLLQVLRGVLGQALAHDSPSELVTWNPRGRNARAENSVRGKRLVTITETDRRMHVDEAQLKHLTGERELSVNQHYAKTEFDTLRTWLIMVATNEMATMTGWDDALAERVLIVPTGPAIPREHRVLDLAEKTLENEGPQVLALLMRQARKYYANGLSVPHTVREATARYAMTQDTVSQWLADCTTPDASHGYRTAMTDAWHAYEQQARDGERLTRNRFHEAMKRQPGIRWKDDGARQRYYTGFVWAA